ncbi:MAG: TSUP family transporter, partial [Mailhella sp.]|nr:TSUP family transporter [Mailhella sp.]
QHFLLRMGLVRASATAKVFNLASNAGAYAVFAASGAVIYAVAIPGAIANILGNQLGTRLAIRVGARAVRNFLYLTLTILLGTLIYRFFLA